MKRATASLVHSRSLWQWSTQRTARAPCRACTWFLITGPLQPRDGPGAGSVHRDFAMRFKIVHTGRLRSPSDLRACAVACCCWPVGERPGRASHTNRPKSRPWSRYSRVSHATRPRSRPFALATSLDLGRWSHHADLPVHFGLCGKSMRSACLDDDTISFLGKLTCTSPFELCRSSV